MTDSQAQKFEPAHARLKRDLPVNAMTVDVEDYFQVSAFEQAIDREDWDGLETRLPETLERVLELFESANIKATFFTLGWVGERFPELIREISDSGHEIASHGYGHRRVTTQDPGAFREDIVRTKAILEDVTGKSIVGYRAASYSIGSENLWALDVLAETGHLYSSSIYPIHHDLYGMPAAPRFAFRVGGSRMLELPVSTVKIFGRNMPCGGGGYFRLLPYFISRWAIRHVNRNEQQPTIFYFHPWEIDPDQPRVRNTGWKSRLRHYTNLSRMERKLINLCGDFRWGRMDEIFLSDKAAS